MLLALEGGLKIATCLFRFGSHTPVRVGPLPLFSVAPSTFLPNPKPPPDSFGLDISRSLLLVTKTFIPADWYLKFLILMSRKLGNPSRLPTLLTYFSFVILGLSRESRTAQSLGQVHCSCLNHRPCFFSPPGMLEFRDWSKLQCQYS